MVLFLVWTVLGGAIIACCHGRRMGVNELLLSPAVGIAAAVIPLFTLSRLGLPIGKVAVPVAIGLIIAAAALLWRWRPIVPWRTAWPFAIVLIGAMWLTARPMFKYG